MAANQDMGAQPRTIVLIHGLWMTPRSWEHWIDRYQHAGHEVLAPAWPGLEVEVESLREDPSPLAHLDIDQILAHYQAIVEQLRQPPVLIGHSIGGTFVQILLDRGLGGAGVAIDPVAVSGVARMPMSTIKSLLPVLRNPTNVRKAVPLTFEEFQESFTNCLSERESRAAYDRYCVPAAGHVAFQGGLANFDLHPETKVEFGRTDRAPLLFISGTHDRISPPSLVLDVANHYRKSVAITDVKEFPGRCHFIIGQQGWEEVADYALSWSLREARTQHAFKQAEA